MMETIHYRPRGVCSQAMEIDVEDGVVLAFRSTGGCNGNLKGIAHLDLPRILYSAYYISDLTGRQLLSWHHIHLEHSNLICDIFHSCIEELHLVAFTYDTVLYLEICYYATE